MKKHNVTRRTVYNWIKSGEIEAQKKRGKWHISSERNVPLDDADDSEDTEQDGKNELIEQLRKENEYLQTELSKANETIAEMQNRHDTIVMSLSNQLADERKKLEDMRDRKLWTRVKTAFGLTSA